MSALCGSGTNGAHGHYFIARDSSFGGAGEGRRLMDFPLTF